ncbi:MAG: M14 family zinc carboxypeptidase, partial [Planctomycetota bacterium]
WTRELCRDHDQLLAIGEEMSRRIEAVNGEFYEAGNTADTIYLASGGANDWTYGATDMLGYAYELRDRGQFGFLLPPDQILPTAEEIFPAAVYLAEEALNLPPRMMLESDPLQAGALTELRVMNAGANEEVYFTYSLTGTGWTPVDLLGHGVGLRAPTLIGTAIADASGSASITTNIPSSAPSIPVWLQAVRVGDETNIVVTEVQN